MASTDTATVLVQEAWQTTGAVPLRIELVDFSEGNSTDAPGSHFVLCFVLQGCGDIRSSFDGLKPRVQYFRAGMFVPVTPPNVSADFCMSAPMRHLMLTVPEITFEPWRTDSKGMRHDEGFEDSLLSEIVRAMWLEAKERNHNGALYADSLRMALAAALVRNADDKPSGRQIARRLSRQELASINAFISERLDEDIGLSDLAVRVQMKERTFTSAFKFATGQTPHQYLMKMRVHRAKDYLANTTKTILEIAGATGFVDQSHLTSVFTRHVGLPPARYRSSVRSCRT